MKPLIAIITISSVIAFQTAPTGAGQSSRATHPSPAARATRATAAAADGGWPRTYTTATRARVVLYQPQVASWSDQKHMTLYAAVSYASPGAQAPARGTLKIESDTSVALADRLVNFSEFRITESSFPTLQKDAVKTVVGEIIDSVPRSQRVLSLDRVLASVDASQITPRNVSGVKADPPVVFFSQVPAVLVNIDGDPIWSPIVRNELQFAVNTNWDLFRHPPTGRFYLRVDQSWLSATAINGPWTRAGTLPGAFASLPADANWADVKAAVPGKPIATGQQPGVFVSTRPAELILLDGVPRQIAVKDTNLVWIGNTDSDLFRMGPGGSLYYLVSGRWFSAPAFTGPWTFATPTLPEDFKRIPLEHPRSRVLASVPGTRQALEAVLLAQVPQTAVVSRNGIAAPEVAYQGGLPQLVQIERTNVSRAVNTDKDVLKVGDLYYLCYQGVWFFGPSATGPWKVADAIPSTIYDIPISSPAHNVTYVTVENSNDEAVEFAAQAAYEGMMVAWGSAMWGTGYYYDPYVWWAGGYPAYFPYYPTYGYGARYNPWTGTYSRGAAVYGPYGGAGVTARYNPSTGTYARGAAAYGPGGARGVATAYNPRTGTSAQTAQGRNVYGSWGSTAVQRGDQWANTSRVTRNATGTTTRATQGSGGGEAITRRGPQGGSVVGKSAGGDVYAGRDGNVYRNQGGSWQKYGDGGWSNVERGNQPVGTSGQLGTQARERAGSSTVDQLNRDRGARAEGTQRTKDLGKASGARAGSYRPSGGGFGGSRGFSGGGMRSGGGRRR
jgi:hypothetical protein